MSNNYDIQQYLVEPRFALWLKEIGLDGECIHWYWDKENIEPQTLKRSAEFDNNWNAHPSKLRISAPTFQQAFDFVEEKLGISVHVINAMGENAKILGKVVVNVVDNKEFEYVLNNNYKTKREASIAACNAIKEYKQNNEQRNT